MSNQPKGPNTAQWTVAKYLAEVYAPQKQLSVGLTDHTAYHYGRIVAMLADCFGRPLRLRELDAAKLDAFEAWSIKQGCVKRTARDRKQTIKMIMRHWRPEEHPKFTGGANLQFLEADVEGSLEHVFQQHYLNEKPEIGSPNTIKQYGRTFRIYTEFLGHTATLADLTDETLGRFLRHRVGAGVKARTANAEGKQIKALWNWAAKKRLVDRYPTIGKLPEPEVVPKAWSEADIERLIAACEHQTGWIEGMPAASYWFAFHAVQWDTGERTGAMLALRWSMLDADEGHLTVPAEIRKGRRKAMVYRLKPVTLETLRSIRRPSVETIFTLRSYSLFQARYKRLIQSAGLPWEPYKSGPQKMRRSFASHITAAGGDATAALRHSSRRVTEESYEDPTIARPEPANGILFDLKREVKNGK